MKRAKLAIAFAAACAALGWQATSTAGPADEIVVVVNKANPAGRLTREELRPIFQTTKSHWPDGVAAEPINLADDSPVRHAFDGAVLGLDPDRVARYWIDRKIRGGERPPRKVSGASAALRVVGADRGAVGYVRVGDVNDSVKIVARIRQGQVVAP